MRHQPPWRLRRQMQQLTTNEYEHIRGEPRIPHIWFATRSEFPGPQRQRGRGDGTRQRDGAPDHNPQERLRAGLTPV